LLCGHSDDAERTLNRALEALAVVANSIRDPELRQKFLDSASVRMKENTSFFAS
jgi:hypothetical protein